MQVSVIVISVRPWKPRSKLTIAGRPVAARAILTAFSTASAPELKRIDFWSVAAAGRELAELAADVDVGLVGGDHEALVQVLVDLRVDRLDHRLGVVPEVLAADAAGEVEVADAVGALDVRAVGGDGDDGRRADAARDPALAGGQQCVGLDLRCGHGGQSPR